jgi:HK97 family phage major capsid protein
MYNINVSNTARAQLSASEQRDLDKFSFTRFILANLPNGKLEGIEKEMVEEGKLENPGVSAGQILSFKAMAAGRGAYRNDLTAGTSGSGSQVVATEDQRPLVDLLFENMPLMAAGATLVTNLRGNLPIPKFTRTVTRATEKAETAAGTEFTPATSMLTMTPKRVPAFIDVTKSFLLQARGVENILRDFLARELAARWEAQAIGGDGTGSNMLGILNTPGIGSVVGGTNGLAATWDKIVDLESSVTVANDIGRRYLINSATRRRLKKTARNLNANDGSSVFGDTLEASLNGYPALVSDLVPSNLTKGTSAGVCSAIIHGDFRDLLLAQWGGVQFLIDPYTQDLAGIVRISAALFVDAAIKRPESFSAMQDALTT